MKMNNRIQLMIIIPLLMIIGCYNDPAWPTSPFWSLSIPLIILVFVVIYLFSEQPELVDKIWIGFGIISIIIFILYFIF